MKIYKPTITIEDNKVIIKAAFESKTQNDTLWFSFDKKYEKYLVTENADAFLVGLLLLAMKNDEDIEVKAPISARLYYQLNHYLINAINLSGKHLQKINIKAEELNDKSLSFNEATAGAALSCGVDSFATIIDHLNEIDIFKIGYFTFHNAGSHSEFGEEWGLEIFKNRLNLIKSYADEIKKEVIIINTNLNEILHMSHKETYVIRDSACILNLQKLFRYYYYPSSLRFDLFKLDYHDMGNYEILVLNMLSTESTTFYSATSQYTRPEKTENITKYIPTYKYLNVCTNHHITRTIENCSACQKCLRTELTLDLLGKLDLYKDVFDLEKYQKLKESYIKTVIAEKDTDMYYKELYNLMKQ